MKNSNEDAPVIPAVSFLILRRNLERFSLAGLNTKNNKPWTPVCDFKWEGQE